MGSCELESRGRSKGVLTAAGFLCLSAQAVIVVTERNSSHTLIERIKQVRQ